MKNNVFNKEKTQGIEKKFAKKIQSVCINAKGTVMKSKLQIIVTIIAIVIISAIVLTDVIRKGKQENCTIDPELARAMTYAEVKKGEEAVEGTDNVKFDAFFLRDIDNDGYAESIRGTSREVGKEDTLYMELNVQTAGYLKDAKITVDGQNFYLQTALPKDNELKDNYIGNINEIEFNQLNNGTQKILTGVVKSAIEKDINSYSKVNSVTLTGTYVGEDGIEKQIEKTVNFHIDWYGKTTTKMGTYLLQQWNNIDTAIKGDKIEVQFKIEAQETSRELILKSNHIEGQIPQLNGYEPLDVVCDVNNTKFNYVPETRSFTIDKESNVNASGILVSKLKDVNTYAIKAIYPIEAYQTLGRETFQLSIPVRAYYEGYNNQNEEFTNPYKSNVEEATIVLKYDKYKAPTEHIYRTEFSINIQDYREKISKKKPVKIYYGDSESEKDDFYDVVWNAFVGTKAELAGIIMKETKDGEEQVTEKFVKTNSEEVNANDVISNVGIYFEGADAILGPDGWIKVYDEETGNLLQTFTKVTWNRYTSLSPYKYAVPVKHIRVETSNVIKSEADFYVHNIKEIDDGKITSKYTLEQFMELQYIKSTLVGSLGGKEVEERTDVAFYALPSSNATISISKDTISTQLTEKNEKIEIETIVKKRSNQIEWQNGIFLVKLPETIIDTQLNEVTINNNKVKLESYEIIEKDNQRFIKIVTKNDTPQIFKITIDVDISPDPRMATTTKSIELYAINKNPYAYGYTYEIEDKYDVDDNSNTKEKVSHSTKSISTISPNSLLTNQVASNYDKTDSIIVSPQIANVKPQYVTVEQVGEESKVTIGVQVKNNYSNTISEIKILGKIPFEGNTYSISDRDMGSTFSTKMKNLGVQIPEELRGIAKVYYSENEKPNKEISDNENGWKTAEQITNWDNVRTYLIDLGEYVMPKEKECVFNYDVKIPNGIDLNKVSFSHHSVYFSLDTENGKYRTQTEPNKLGLRIAETFDLEVQKYQKGKANWVSGATYKIKAEGEEKSKTGITNSQGILKISNLYAEKIYEIKETATPDEYALNEDVIKFIAHVNSEGKLTVEKLEGSTREDIEVIKNEGENYKAVLKVEDEVKATIKITKKQQGTENKIPYVRYRITGHGLSENGKILTTNKSGETTIKGMSVNQEYTLQEIKAEGYYLADPIKFKIVNNNGNYAIETIQGNIKDNKTTEIENIPTIELILENQKIPVFNLEVTKIKRTQNTNISTDEIIAKTEIAQEDIAYLSGARFRLYKGTEEIGDYITDSEGKITITELYQYSTENKIDQTYTLKEISAPEGYVKGADIIFKVENVDGKLQLKTEDGKEYKYTENGNTINLVVENNPSFRLVKKDKETQEVIANVKFAIYNTEDEEQPVRNSKGEIVGTKEIIDGKEYYTLTTNGSGEIAADLTEGLYKVIEIQTLEGYKKDSTPYYFGVGKKVSGKEVYQKEWEKSIGGVSEYTSIDEMFKTSDEGYLARGYFYQTIELENGEVIENSGSQDGMIIKYDSNCEIEWARGIGGDNYDNITTVIETRDGGYLVGVDFSSDSIDLGNEIILSGEYYNKGAIIKYDSNGQAQWAKTIGREINSIVETKDGGYLVGGSTSGNMDLGNGVTLEDSAEMIIKYDSNGQAQWAKVIEKKHYTDEITSIIETRDGGYLVGGNFSSNSIDLGNGVTLESSGGLIIKYDNNSQAQWAKAIGGNINSIVETKDGGYLVGGNFSSDSIDLGNGVIINNIRLYESNGMIIKCNSNGQAQWARAIGGKDEDKITSIIRSKDGEYIIYYSNNIFKYNQNEEIEWEKVVNTSVKMADITNNGKLIVYSDGKWTRYRKNEVTEAVVERTKVIETNESKDINSIIETSDGGYLVSYCKLGRIIKYDSKRQVQWARSIGDSNYDEITSITETRDGGYLVGGSLESDSIDLGNGVTINKVGSGYANGMIIKYDSKGQAEWAKVIEGRSDDATTSIIETRDGGYLVGGNFPQNSIELGNGVTLEASGRMIVKYDSKGQAQWADVNSVGTINSMAQLNDGSYVIVGYISVEGYIGAGTFVYSSLPSIMKISEIGNIEFIQEGEQGYDNFDFLYEDQNISVYPTNDAGFIVGGIFSISQTMENGESLINKGSKDGKILKYGSNGKLEWSKAIGGRGTDKIISVVETENNNYKVVGYFDSETVELEKGDILVNNNSENKSNIITLNIKAQTAIPDNQEIVVENEKKEFRITTEVKEINGETGGSISGEYDTPYEIVKYGDGNTKEIVMTPNESYEIINITVNGEEYQFEPNADGSYTMPELENITENKHIVVTYAQKEQKIIINKIDSKTKKTLEGAKFKLEQIDETLADSELYRSEEITTNSQGQAITQIPFGKYKLTETKAPKGYVLNEEPTIIEFKADGTHKFTIENNETAKVLVHHYIKGTTEKVAEDVLTEGEIGSRYTSTPHLNLEKYELQKDEKGSYVVPENATGTYEAGIIQVNYYYEAKQIPLKIYHYIEGTTIPVPLKDGSEAPEVIEKGTEGTEYRTQEIDEELLGEDYELVEVPKNSTGTYGNEEINVIYYYKKVERKVVINKYQEDGKTPLEGVKFTINRKGEVDKQEYTTNAEGKIELTLEAGEYIAEEIEAPTEYKIPQNAKTEFAVTKVEDVIELNITNNKKQGTITVHYYIEGTTQEVPLKDGNTAQTETRKGTVGDIYATKQKENVLEKFELIEIPENASGNYIDGNIEITYYYKLKETKVIVHHYLEGTTTELVEDVIKNGKVGESYTTEVATDIPENYELVAEPINKNGIMIIEPIEVIYYYRLKTPEIVSNIKKESSIEKFTDITQKIPYTITYEATIDKYIGNGSVTITDKLPYAIDASKSQLNGGTYDEENKTITWTQSLTEIDTFTNGVNQVKIIKQIELEYKNIDTTKLNISNEVEGKIDLQTPEKTETVTDKEEIPTQYVIDIKVNKIWKDQGNQYGKRPNEIVAIVKDGIKVVKRANMNKENNWQCIFTNLPKYNEAGEEIVYTVDENEVNKDDLFHYTKQIGNLTNSSTNEEQKEITITNKMTKIPGYVNVKYIDKNTDKEISDMVEKEGVVGESFDVAENKKEITGYTLVEEPQEKTGTYTKEPQDKVYYYAKNTSVIVKYLNKLNNEVLTEEPQYEIEGYEGKDYNTEQKEIEDYVFVESTDNISGKMTKDVIEVIYYYGQKARATVQHIDRETNEILKAETQNGKVGDLFETQAEDFEGYVLVQEPKKPNVLMTKEEQIIKYYYAKVSAGVIEKHIDDITGELLGSEEHNGNEGDEYNIPSKDFEGYDLVEEKLPENREGKMTVNIIEVKYYYIKKASVRVEYKDILTKEKLEEDIIIEGHENDIYETEEKEFENYDLVEQPKNATGKMVITKNEDGTYNTEIVVTYYYIKRAGGVKERHIDIKTNKELASQEHKGHVDDEYNIPAREFKGYKLVETKLPTNSKGKMTEEPIQVDYYYIKETKVRVEYIDKLTGEKIDEEEIKGHEGDSYKTEEKQFDNYDLVEKPKNTEGEMESEEIVVKYYYKKKAEIEVQYLEKDTNYPLSEKETAKGYVGDKYETKEKEIPYYKFVESTNNTKGTMADEKITIIYYYQKRIFNLSVDKWLSSVNMNGIVTGARDYNTKNQLYKMEVYRNKTTTADIKFTYKIRISNKGEIEGTVGRVTEIIPQGFSFNQEDNSIHWEEKNGTLVTETLKTQAIKPGEYKEIEVILRWNKGEENFGSKNNTVMIGEISNPAGFEDLNKEDNSSKSELLLGIATGFDRNGKIIIIGIVQIFIAIAIGILVSYKKKEK